MEEVGVTGSGRAGHRQPRQKSEHSVSEGSTPDGSTGKVGVPGLRELGFYPKNKKMQPGVGDRFKGELDFGETALQAGLGTARSSQEAEAIRRLPCRPTGARMVVQSWTGTRASQPLR